MKKKIAIIAANGRQGALLTQEALLRGHDVTAVVRNSRPVCSGVKLLKKDILALTAAELQGFDAVIDAFGAWTPETLALHSTTLAHLCNCLKGSKTRLLIVGGAGSLYADDAKTVMLMDTPGFPDIFKPVAKATADAFAELKLRKDVLWTYLCPAADFQADGARTGKYTLGGEVLTLNSKGESVISYADYAIAMIDEAEKGKYIQKRFSVVSE